MASGGRGRGGRGAALLQLLNESARKPGEQEGAGDAAPSGPPVLPTPGQTAPQPGPRPPQPPVVASGDSEVGGLQSVRTT